MSVEQAKGQEAEERYPFTTSNDAADKWEPVEAERAEPDGHMQRLMDAVAEAIDGGLFYTSDVFDAVAKSLGDYFEYPNDPEIRRVEGGVRGMEVYYARGALNARRERAANREAVKLFAVGQKLKELRFGVSRYSTGEVVGVFRESGEVKLHLTKRGSRNRWEITVGAARLPRPEAPVAPQPTRNDIPGQQALGM